MRIVAWPDEREALDELAAARTPRLVVVEGWSEPPVSSDCCQDWMWRTGDVRELRLRLRQLSLRALGHGHDRPRLDALGMLHVGLRSVHLPAKEQALAAVLLQRFNDVVPRDDMVAAAWPEGISRPTVLATRISALRSRLAWVGLEIRGSSRRGYCLQAGTSNVTGGDGSGFEDELDATRWVDGRAPPG